MPLHRDYSDGRRRGGCAADHGRAAVQAQEDDGRQQAREPLSDDAPRLPRRNAGRVARLPHRGHSERQDAAEGGGEGGGGEPEAAAAAQRRELRAAARGRRGRVAADRGAARGPAGAANEPGPALPRLRLWGLRLRPELRRPPRRPGRERAQLLGAVGRGRNRHGSARLAAAGPDRPGPLALRRGPARRGRGCHRRLGRDRMMRAAAEKRPHCTDICPFNQLVRAQR
mmetsp:Transcript_96229/g.144099  ORF Transcript_96229/g.144099 Transcript_96229/m.144099 type:complete len:227 (+) Transcript_96229:749-1429(+)